MTFTTGQTLLIQVQNVVDGQGQPTTFKNPPKWSSSDSTILNPTVAPDGLSAQGVALKAGAVTVSVVGDGVLETVTLNLGAGDVVSFNLVVSAAPAAPVPPPAP